MTLHCWIDWRHPKKVVLFFGSLVAIGIYWSYIVANLKGFERPECVQILTRDRAPETLPRLISSIPPSYPTVPYLTNVKARVVVTFVVSDSGKVEESRVYESSDSRFNESALEAVRQWRFLPAIISGRPTKEIITIPMEFGGRRK